MNELDKFKARFGPSQTNHKRLAEIKLTQERLNKKPDTGKKFVTRKVSTLGGAGALELVGGASLFKGAFNLSKSMKVTPFVDIQIKDK